MRFKLLLVLLALAARSFAVNPYLPFSIDVEDSGEDPQFDIQSRVLSTPTLRFYTFQGTNVFDPRTYVSTFSFAEDWNATNMVKITGTNYSSYVEFAVTSNTFAYPIDKWYASVLLTKPADGGVFAWAYGYISLKPSPEANANASFFYTHAVNGSEYTPFTGSFSNWPFALKEDYAGGYVGVLTWNATNLLFEGRIKTNETDIVNIKITNSIIQSNLTYEISRATNSESIISNMVVAETSRATNIEAIISNAYVAAVAAEISRATNAEAIVSNAAMAAISTETSRATNSEFIISNAYVAAIAAETSRATNAEAIVSNAYVAAIAAEISRATNAELVISNTFASAFTNQGGTNSGFETRMALNDAFRTTTQPASNSALQGQITLNLTNQNATNAVFQNQITLNLTNQNATNTVFQNQVTLNLTNQNATNISFNSRISSNETFRITTQPATNAALQSQITLNLTNQNATNANLQAQISSFSATNTLLYRYDAYPAVPNTIWVFATSTNITAVRSGYTFTFTIPSGTRMLSSKIRVDGGNTDSGKIYLVLGTNDMNNSSTVNNWIPVCNATRDDTYANVPVTAQTYSGDNSQIVISGLGAIGGITYHIESRF